MCDSSRCLRRSKPFPSAPQDLVCPAKESNLTLAKNGNSRAIWGLFTHPQSGEVLIVLTLEKPGFSCYPRSFSSSDARRDVHQRLPP